MGCGETASRRGPGVAGLPAPGWRLWTVLLPVAALGVALGGIRAADVPPGRDSGLVWARGGLVVPATLRQAQIWRDGKRVECRAVALNAARTLLAFQWQPGQNYRLVSSTSRGSEPARESTLVAPWRPEPVALFQFPLEDVAAAALGGTWPDAVVKFNRSGTHLAVGSFGRWLRIIEIPSGRTVYAERLAEGWVKTLAWAPDGRTLYVGEQSPDAFLGAMELGGTAGGGLLPRWVWRVRLADQIETSRPPADDRFGVYTLPGIFDLEVADDGRLLVAAVHSWTASDGHLRNRSLVACYSPSGQKHWQFPVRGAAPATFTSLGTDRAATRVIVLPHQSQAAEPSPEAQVGSLHLIDGATGQLLDRRPIAPLVPEFDRVEAWDSLAISDDATRAAVGLADGRGWLYDLAAGRLEPLEELPLGTPRRLSGTPVVAAVSYARFAGSQLLLQTQNAHIPFSHAQAAVRAPAAHRGANTLAVFDRQGTPLWRFSGVYALGGQWPDRAASPGGSRWLLVAARELPSGSEPSPLGALLFDLQHAGGGVERLAYYYPTLGPPLFQADLSEDGLWAALVESPAPTPDGRDVYGTYQVHVVH